MRLRKGDWRDLLYAHLLAADGKKVFVGFLAALFTLFFVFVGCWLYVHVPAGLKEIGLGAPGFYLRRVTEPIDEYSTIVSEDNLVWRLADESRLALRKERTMRQGEHGIEETWSYLTPNAQERTAEAFGNVLPLLNPFYLNDANKPDAVHFVFSILIYVGLLRVWTLCGGIISRLAVLQYGRDELPQLREATRMVRSRQRAYFYAAGLPLLGLIVLVLLNILIGVIGSIPAIPVGGEPDPWFVIPAIGPWLRAVLEIPAALAAFVIVSVSALGVLAFGLMAPAISSGGKDHFEGWSSAYSYVLYGLNRFIGYSAVAAVLGVVSIGVVYLLGETFIVVFEGTIGLGYVNMGWLGRAHELPGAVGTAHADLVVRMIRLCARLCVMGYAFSYYFTANSIICLLLRKHVDRIEIDEIFHDGPQAEANPATDDR